MSLLLCPRYNIAPPPAGVVSFGNVTLVGEEAVHFKMGNDGFAYQNLGLIVPMGPHPIGPWIAPQVGMSLYECMATPTSSTFPTEGTLDTWLDLAQTWSWGFQFLGGTKFQGDSAIYPDRSATFTVQIRRKSDQVVVDTFTVSIEASPYGP